MKFYLVGGAVRDELMNLPPKDIDLLVTGCSFSDLQSHLSSVGAQIKTCNEKFLTLSCTKFPLFPDRKDKIDIALPRAEADYSDGRRPDSVEVCSLEADLSRRDFTMNAMAKDLDSGEIVDLFGGKEDIANSRINTVGSAVERFAEDGLRVIRALRFAVTLGFSPSMHIYSALENLEPETAFAGVSEQRFRDELCKMHMVDSYRAVQVLFGFPKIAKYVYSVVGLQPTLGRVKLVREEKGGGGG